MTASVASFLTQAQKKGKELPTALSGALLLAAVRLSDAKAQAIRPYQLLVDDDGALDLLTGDPPTGDGYAAPELRNGAVLSDDPRVLVYAAGALGYELITLTPPRGQAGQEVQGPLAPVIRKAMAERQHRYKSLADMARAIERIQGRPGREEERLILAAVAGSTPLPAAQKLAKIELGRTAIPEGASAPPVEPAGGESQPVFTQVWDPLEPQAAPAATPPPAEPRRRDPDVLEPLRAELEAEKKARKDLTTALESRMSELAQMGTRLALLEEQVRSSPAPQQSLSAAAALARDAQHLLEQRRFGEAERLLQHPLAANDPLLQFRLGQALSSMTDPDGAQKARAVGAFRRAADLDASWAEPRARLGALLWRQGRESEARTHLEAALKLDPRCSEALALLTPAAPRKSRLGFAVAGAAALLSAAVAFILLRPLPLGPARGSLAASPISLSALPPAPQLAQPAPAPAVPDPAPAAPPPVPPAAALAPRTPPKAAALPALPPPERKREPEAEAEPEPRPQRATRPDPKPKPKKVDSASRSAAAAESAKGDKALRAFDTKSAEAAFSAALRLDPSLPAAHRGMGMVYVLLGKNAEAKAAYARYLQLSPDAPDKEQIARLLSR